MNGHSNKAFVTSCHDDILIIITMDWIYIALFKHVLKTHAPHWLHLGKGEK